MSSTTALLEQATARYESAVNEVLPYLAARGIGQTVAVNARMGSVQDPEPGHEEYYGRLVIPYLTRAGVVNLKFRCIEDHDCKERGCPKYLGLHGGAGKPRLYNVEAFFARSQIIGIAEGEFDALVLSHYAGLPTVGCPGVSTWQSHFPRCFQGYGQVLIFADGDDPGKQWARMIAKQVNPARIITMPEGMDVNDMFQAEGAEGLRKRAGLT